MTTRDDDFNPRPGRIRHGNRGAKRPKSFVGEVIRAAKKAGHRGPAFKGSGKSAGRSTFGRGRRAAPLHQGAAPHSSGLDIDGAVYCCALTCCQQCCPSEQGAGGPHRHTVQVWWLRWGAASA